jgi:hypothetical protein
MYVNGYHGRKDISYIKLGPNGIQNHPLTIDETSEYIKLLRESSLERFIPKRTCGKNPYATVPPKATWRETLIRVSSMRYIWENPSMVRNILKWNKDHGESPDAAFFLGHCVNADDITQNGFNGETGAGHSIIYNAYLKEGAFKIFYDLINEIEENSAATIFDPNFSVGVSMETRKSNGESSPMYLPKTLPAIKKYLGIE